MTDKPLLLLDVDGPLNAFGGPYSGRPAPAGYALHRLRERSFTDDKGRAWIDGGLRIWLNPDHGPMLMALAGTVELAWCTAWRDDANRYISPMIGLPVLPVVPLPDGWQTLTGHIWKRPGVEAYAAGRALAWLDDEFTAAGFDWAAQRTADGVATLPVHVDPLYGLRQEDVREVADWAARVPAAEPVQAAS